MKTYLLTYEKLIEVSYTKEKQLMFIGDGYKAITMMMRNCKDYAPVREKFQAQLNTREKCKLTMKK